MLPRIAATCFHETTHEPRLSPATMGQWACACVLLGLMALNIIELFELHQMRRNSKWVGGPFKSNMQQVTTSDLILRSVWCPFKQFCGYAIAVRLPSVPCIEAACSSSTTNGQLAGFLPQQFQICWLLNGQSAEASPQAHTKTRQSGFQQTNYDMCWIISYHI